MTTKVHIINAGPNAIQVAVVDGSEHKIEVADTNYKCVLQVGQHTEQYVHDGAALFVKEIK